MTVASLVDTNVVVYRFDARFPRKRQIATELLRTGIAQGSLRVPHQAIVERSFRRIFSTTACTGRCGCVTHSSRRVTVHVQGCNRGIVTSRCDRHALETR